MGVPPHAVYGLAHTRASAGGIAIAICIAVVIMAMVWQYRWSGPLWRSYDDAAADSTGLRPNRRGKGVLPTILTAQFVGIALQNSMAALIGGITK